MEIWGQIYYSNLSMGIVGNSKQFLGGIEVKF